LLKPKEHQVAPLPVVPSPQPSPSCGDSPKVIPQKTGTQVMNFNTTWCGHSKDLAPTWDKLMNEFKSNSSIELIDMKCEGDNIDVCSSYKIEGFPTILKFKDGVRHNYSGDRSFESLKAFCLE